MKSAFRIPVMVALALCAAAVQAFGVDLSALLSPEVAMGLSGAGAVLATNYVQEGKVIDYVNTTGVAIGTGDVVVIGHILGVALVDIPIAGTGAVCIEGVFTVPKVAAAVWAQGDDLVWDVSAGKFDDNAAVKAAGDVSGPPAVAFSAGANLEVTGLVKFTGCPGTVT